MKLTIQENNARGRCASVAGLIVLWSATSVWAQAPGSSGGFGSEAQATRGKAEFAKYCAGCHTIDKAQGDAFVANPPDGSKFVRLPLAGGGVINKWRTAGDLYSKIRRTMPANNANGLSDDVYLDIAAYLLQANGLPAGKDLTRDVSVLHKSVLDAKLASAKSQASRCMSL